MRCGLEAQRVLGNHQGCAVLIDSLGLGGCAVQVIVLEDDREGQDLLGDLDLGVPGGGDLHHGVAVLIGGHVVSVLGKLHEAALAVIGGRIPDLYHVLVAFLDLGYGDGDLVGILGAKALNVHILAVYLEGDVEGVGIVAILIGGLFAGDDEVYVIVGLTLLSQNLIQLILDVLQLLGGNFHVNVVAVAEVYGDVKGEVLILVGLVQDGSHGDLYLTVTVLVGGVNGHVVGAGLLIHDDLVGIVGGIVRIVGLRLVKRSRVIGGGVSSIAHNRHHLRRPACEGKGVSCVGFHGRSGRQNNVIAVEIKSAADQSAIPIQEGDGVLVEHHIVAGFDGNITHHVGVVAVPTGKGVSILRVGCAEGVGRRNCVLTVLDGHNRQNTTVPINEGHFILGHLEDNLNGSAARRLLVSKLVFIIGIRGHDNLVAVLISDNDFVDLIAHIRGDGDRHGIAGGGIFGINGDRAILGGLHHSGVFLALDDHVNLAVCGNSQLDHRLAVAVNANDLEINLNEIALGILYVNNKFSLRIGQRIQIDTDGIAAVAVDPHILTVHAEVDLILDSGLAVHGGHLAGGVNGYVFISLAKLGKDLIQLANDVLNFVRRQDNIHGIAAAEVVGIIQALGRIIRQILQSGAQGHVDLGSAFPVGACDVNVDIAVILADIHIVVGIIVIAGVTLENSGVDGICVCNLHHRAPRLEAVGIIQICGLGGIRQSGKLTPSHGGGGM